MDVQVGNGSGSNHQAYLWQYGKPGGETVFDFRILRGREGPKKFLAQYAGILQTDGYQRSCGRLAQRMRGGSLSRP